MERSKTPHTPEKRNGSNGVPAVCRVVRLSSALARSATYRALAGDVKIGVDGAERANGEQRW